MGFGFEPMLGALPFVRGRRGRSSCAATLTRRARPQRFGSEESTVPLIQLPAMAGVREQRRRDCRIAQASAAPGCPRPQAAHKRPAKWTYPGCRRLVTPKRHQPGPVLPGVTDSWLRFVSESSLTAVSLALAARLIRLASEALGGVAVESLHECAAVGVPELVRDVLSR